MRYRCAILDDYQKVALTIADWSSLRSAIDLEVFNAPLGDQERVIVALKEFAIICLMRERTPFPRAVFERLPNLRLVVTSGMRNAAIDLLAARDHNVVVSGTEASNYATAELTWGLILELARNIGLESARLKAGAWWQSTIGLDLADNTLGVVGLGRLGSRVAAIGRAFGMQVIAWSENLTREKAHQAGVELVTKDDLFGRADFVSIHLQLSPRTRHLIRAAELSRMQPTSFLVNTSRGPIVEEAALLRVLKEGRIAGAGLDVYDVEPLPTDHAFRQLSNVVLTPHLGYVTKRALRGFYTQMVENIHAFIEGTPVRVLDHH